MAVMTNFTVGDRIKYYREGRGLSQKTLGELVGRSENWVWKVEHNQLPLSRMPVLIDLARALRVKDLSDLTGGVVRVATDSGCETEHPSVSEVRRALSLPASSLGTGETDWSVQELSDAVEQAWTVYETSTRRYAQVGVDLPLLLGRAYSTIRSTSGDEQAHLAAIRVLVSLFGLHQIWLRRVGEPTLARVASDRALALADETGDPVIKAFAGWNLACVFTSTGEVENSVELARNMIDSCAPGADASAEHLSVYGALHLQGAVASVRANKAPIGWDLYNKAQQLAQQTGESNSWHTCWGPTNVAMHAVHLAAEEGDAGEALRRADAVELSGAVPLERSTRYLIEVMNCNRIQRDDYGTVFVLKRLMEVSPEEITFSSVVRDAVADLLKREKPVWRSDLRVVATHIGLAA